MDKWLRHLLFYAPRLDEKQMRCFFEGRCVVVTGASRGIGEAMVRRLMRVKARLVLVARSEERLQQLCQEAEALGCEARYYALDLRDRPALDALCLQLRQELPQVDYLFCNAGKSIHRTLADSADRLHDFDRTMDVNYRSLVALALALLPGLEAARGKVIYTSSISTCFPAVGGWAAYHASKEAANVWCRTARREWRAKGIQVKIAYLPLVHTQMSDPTPLYRRMPAFTADEAGRVLLRLAMNNRQCYKPWWALCAV